MDVVLCLQGDITSAGMEVIEEHRSGDLRRLVAAIAAPSRPASWFSFTDVDASPVPLVWLVDANGRAMLAELPREREHGLVAPPVLVAIDQLTLVSRTIHRPSA
ncbi:MULTISPECIES: hypothetical protein [Nocardiaceae]|uniref:Uncharacterized protein n=1 Tax=Rhodococcoides kroppenstedtii TaxID=293050 RepID=A0ABS7NX14_9NOCA|nr:MULTISPECIES: hypothetical protein [Rhodococcus]MBY6314876.1 hypothetical protein [Rhodococcus kroppenstedtii]MBY6322556.1 hypothetical protein [Rhodococcus kroppenstedtii]MBY6401360.1 hypothetical protein [Rhodococcus kroppenstedtii]